MKNISLTVAIVIALVTAGAGFFAGTKFGGNTAQAANTAGGRTGGTGRFGGLNGANRNGGGFTTGDVLSKDAQSITIKMRDGGSKIVFYTTSTQTMKTVDGTSNDIAVGNTVMVSGDTNSDGSLTAKMIQIRPNQPPSTGATTSTNQ